MKDDNHSTFALLAMVAIVAIVGMVVMFMNIKTTAKESGTLTVEEAANALGDAKARGDPCNGWDVLYYNGGDDRELAKKYAPTGCVDKFSSIA